MEDNSAIYFEFVLNSWKGELNAFWEKKGSIYSRLGSWLFRIKDPILIFVKSKSE